MLFTVVYRDISISDWVSSTKTGNKGKGADFFLGNVKTGFVTRCLTYSTYITWVELSVHT